jgi:hypothetical protein
MSKLADAIRRSQRIEATPMGFGAARPAAKATMLVGVVGGDATVAAAARDAGADLVLIDAGNAEVAASDGERLRQGAGELALGVLGRLAADAGTRLRESGLDFVAFDADSTPATALLDEDLGYVLALPKDASETFLRSLEPLSLDAVYLAEMPPHLTVAGQIEIGRISLFARKPIITRVQAGASKEELQCLRAAGVVVLLVDDASAVSSLKETVLALPAKRQRRDDRPVLALPRAAAPAAPDEGDDDDE